VFSILEALNVGLCVIVVTALGFGRGAVAYTMLLFEYCGFGFLAVIFVWAIGGIGAYLVRPVCIAYGIAKSPPAPAPAPAPAPGF